MVSFEVPPADELPAGTLLAGRYRVERLLGAGGMGIVAKVVHVESGEIAALKLLRPGVARDASAARRFLREAEAAGRIRNRRVVRISDVGKLENGSPFLVMEYLEGTTLEKRLGQDVRLDLAEACDLALQTAEGLAAAHATGVIHRDIKPANLHLSHVDGDAWQLKIGDFGVSKILDPEGGAHLTRTQTALGSPLYMSPEQMRSARSADFRADQWSLGAVLYRMATGALPFDAKSLPRLCAQVLSGELVPLASRRPELPAPFSQAVERCLRVSPDERYPTVADFAEAIAPFASQAGRLAVGRCRELLDGAAVNASSANPDAGAVDP